MSRNNGLERDHQHIKQRLYPMRGFKQAVSDDLFVRRRAFIQNRRNGFAKLTTQCHLR